jgi:hypothetical protein
MSLAQKASRESNSWLIYHCFKLYSLKPFRWLGALCEESVGAIKSNPLRRNGIPGAGGRSLCRPAGKGSVMVSVSAGLVIPLMMRT